MFVGEKRKKKVHRQQQHFHVTVYITKMWLKKRKIGKERAKTSPSIFYRIVGAHKDKSMSSSLSVLPRETGGNGYRYTPTLVQPRSHSGPLNPRMDIVASSTGGSVLRSNSLETKSKGSDKCI
jgi:hypothetical protein